MAKRHHLNGEQLEELLYLLFDKHLQKSHNLGFLVNSRDKSKSIGYGEYDPQKYYKEIPKGAEQKARFSKESLKYSIVTDPEVAKIKFPISENNQEDASTKTHLDLLMEVGFKPLATKYAKFKTVGLNTFNLSAPLWLLCTTYLGIKDNKDLDNSMEKRKRNREVVGEENISKITSNKKHENFDQFKFNGYYYSYKNHEIKSFDLSIFYNGKNKKYYVEEQFFHESNERLFSGEVKKSLGNLSGILHTADEEHTAEMYIVINLADQLKSTSVFSGSICTLYSSGQSHPINVEFVIVNNENELSEEEQLEVERYLFLHRYNIRIKKSKLNLGGLRAKGKLVSHVKAVLEKRNYYTWRFDLDYNVWISNLQIEDNYKITCSTKAYKIPQYNNQVCLLHPNKDARGGNTLCISTHPQFDTGIISYLMIDQNTSDSGILKGVMIHKGKGRKKKTRKSALILIPVDEIDKSLLKIWKKDELPEFLKAGKNQSYFNLLLKKELENTIPSDIIALSNGI